MPADENVTAAQGQVRRAQTLDQIGVTLVGVSVVGAIGLAFVLAHISVKPDGFTLLGGGPALVLAIVLAAPLAGVGVVAMALAHYLVGAATTALVTAVAEQRRRADE
jgi:hypothetical protein